VWHLSQAALATGLGWLALAAAGEPTSQPNPHEITALIRDLGSDRFATREAASDHLARLGLPAFTALEEATRNPDREIRFRAERILTVIRKNDLERRLAAFIAGTGDDDYQLPAWSRFSKGYSDTEASRQMFVEMQRAEPELLAALQQEPRAAVEVLGRRLAERSPTQIRVGNTPPMPSKGEVAAYLFVAAEEDANVSASSLQLLSNMARQPVLLMVRSPKEGELTKKLVANVVRRCEIEAAMTWMGLARELELKEALVPAIKALEQHEKFNRQTIMVVAIAAACVAEMGNESHIQSLEKLLQNQTVVSQSSSAVVVNGQRSIRQREMQVRDVALAALVTLTKQDAKQYYGEEIAPRTRSPYSTFPVMTVGFETGADGEKQRAAAQQKWSEYKLRQQKPDEKAPAGP
jgi:hypothetical protein